MTRPLRRMRARKSVVVIAMAAAMTGCATWPSQFGSRTGAQAVSEITARSPDSASPHGSAASAQAKADYDLAKFWIAQGRNDLASKVLERLLANEPHHAEALNARASLAASAGDWPAAERDLSLAIQSAPERAHLYFNLGLLLTKRGESEKGRHALERTIALDPGHARAKEVLATLPSKLPTREPILSEHFESQQSADSALQAAEAQPVTLARQSPTSGVTTSAVSTSQSQDAQTQSLDAGVVRVSQHDAVVRIGEDVFETPISNPITLLVRESVDANSRAVSVNLEPATPVIRVTGAQLDLAPQQARTPAIIAIAPQPAEAARIDVANGNGINGMARALRGQLRAVGVQVATISNWSNFNQPVTRVLYREGHEQAARDLAQRLPVSVELVAVTRLPRADRDVMVVLGRDMRNYRPTASGWESMAQVGDHPAA